MSRRSRYTITIQDQHGNVSKSVILAYAGQSQQIVNHYNGLGFVVLGIAKGDYRKAERAAMPTWTLDQSNYQDALDFLGIKLPVKIEKSRRDGRSAGSHTLGSTPCGRLYHKIMVRSWLTADEAGRTLWHELCHAMQAERTAADAGAHDPIAILTAWRLTPDREGSYDTRAIEVEARSYEDFNHENPLAR